MICLGKYFRIFVLENKQMTDSELKLLLEKQELLLRKLLELSQRQFAESDAVALDELLKQKDSYFDELQKLDPLREKWHKKYNRPLGKEEQKLDDNIQDLLEKLLLSEQDFEKIVGREKNAVSLQIAQISNQMQYRKDTTRQRPLIKNMKT